MPIGLSCLIHNKLFLIGFQLSLLLKSQSYMLLSNCLLNIYFSLVTQKLNAIASDSVTPSKKSILFSREMETKALCFVFVFLILVTFPPETEAGINGWRQRNGRRLFQKKRKFWVSTFIKPCLDNLFVSVFSLSFFMYRGMTYQEPFNDLS